MTQAKATIVQEPGGAAPSPNLDSAEPRPTIVKRRVSRQRNAGRLLDLQQAEAYSGISAWTLRQLIAAGDLPTVRPPGLRRVWLDRADLDKAISQWKEVSD